MVPKLFSFSKEERLSGHTRISELFSQGRGFVHYPFKVLLVDRPDNPCVKVLISVPKRIFNKANVRNTLKRRVREAYRINKGILPPEKKIDLALIYISKEILPYSFIEMKLVETLNRFKSI